jgi:hypothetical protein
MMLNEANVTAVIQTERANDVILPALVMTSRVTTFSARDEREFVANGSASRAIRCGLKSQGDRLVTSLQYRGKDRWERLLFSILSAKRPCIRLAT